MRPTIARARNALALGDNPEKALREMIEELTANMHQAAENLQFEVAARIRDEVTELKKELRQFTGA